jgi:NADPH:quinone reductase-like Zn-dependent oxidoreductase
VPDTVPVVLATSYGGPEVLTVADEPLADPGPGEVLIDVRAAGVNPADWKRYSGQWGTDPADLPLRLGFEASGVVAAAGPDATGPAGPVAEGDEVIAFRISGAYAARIVVPAGAVVPKPRKLTFEQAGGLLLTGVTAVHTLVATGVGDGDTVLVHGAAGGVGSMIVQLARARGARVIGTASERNHDRLRRLGAEPVTYGDGLAGRVREVAPDGVDAAIDTVGTDEAIDVSLELVLPDRHRIATIAAFGRAPELGIKALGGGPGADAGEEIRDRARMELVRLADEGKVTVDAEPYPLREVAIAHRASMEGHADGKIVLVP